MRTLILTVVVDLALAVGLAGQPPGFRTETVATGLDLASAMAFAPDGRLFVAERVTGKIRVWEKGQLAGTWATIQPQPLAPRARTRPQERTRKGE